MASQITPSFNCFLFEILPRRVAHDRERTWITSKPFGTLVDMRKSTYPWITITLACLLAGCSGNSNSNVGGSKAVSPNYHLLSSCPKPENASIAAIISEALCGSISVFEDRESRSGRKINLNVMVLPATTRGLSPDPIFFLAGGPGQSAVDTGPYLFSRLYKLRRERDVVLVDQRGTGESNSLACQVDAAEIEQLGQTIEEMMSIEIGRFKECLQEYDANPALYTTPIAMDDLNEVREILGFDKINLLGISYGTRAALVYIRRHEASVRSAVLDAVVPLTMTIPANVAIDAQSAFDRLLMDCQAQPGCAAQFPDLGQHFRDLVQRLTNNPGVATISHPRTGEPISSRIDSRAINRLVRGILYDRTLSRLLPFSIEAAYEGNFQPLISLALSMVSEDTTISNGMMASVLCSEDMQRVTESRDSPDFDNALYEALLPVCEFWPKGKIEPNYFEAVKSTVPVLLTSGTLDPITPPKYGWEAAATLSNSGHIVVSGVGHGTVATGCLPELLHEFFVNPDPNQLDEGCTTNLSRPPYFTSLAGPVSMPEKAVSRNADD